jgi:hypothetical protein
MYAAILLNVHGMVFFIFLLIAILLAVFWVRMLVSAIQNKEMTDGEKYGWILAIIFFQLFAAVPYYYIKYRKGNTPKVT